MHEANTWTISSIIHGHQYNRRRSSYLLFYEIFLFLILDQSVWNVKEGYAWAKFEFLNGVLVVAVLKVYSAAWPRWRTQSATLTSLLRTGGIISRGRWESAKHLGVHTGSRSILCSGISITRGRKITWRQMFYLQRAGWERDSLMVLQVSVYLEFRESLLWN
jgi:hypothetical protein